jgi:hypothetical protein
MEIKMGIEESAKADAEKALSRVATLKEIAAPRSADGYTRTYEIQFKNGKVGRASGVGYRGDPFQTFLYDGKTYGFADDSSPRPSSNYEAYEAYEAARFALRDRANQIYIKSDAFLKGHPEAKRNWSGDSSISAPDLKEKPGSSDEPKKLAPRAESHPPYPKAGIPSGGSSIGDLVKKSEEAATPRTLGDVIKRYASPNPHTP